MVAVTAQMNRTDAVIGRVVPRDNVAAFANQVILHSRDVSFITRNSARTQDNDIAVFDLDETMSATRHTVKHGIQLTLVTSTNDTNLVIW